MILGDFGSDGEIFWEIDLSRLAWKIVVMARQKARGKRQE